MERADATHVTVGGILLAVGGVALSILTGLAASAAAQSTTAHPWTAAWFLIGSVLTGALAAVGLYMTVAVYTGWPLPTTATERSFTPNLEALNARPLTTASDDSLVGVLVQLTLRNHARGSIPRAVLNLTVPQPARFIYRATESGRVHSDDGSYSDLPARGQLTWNGYVNFEGRMTKALYFCIGLDALSDFPLSIRVTAAELSKALIAHFDVTLAAQPNALVPGPATSERES